MFVVIGIWCTVLVRRDKEDNWELAISYLNACKNKKKLGDQAVTASFILAPNAKIFLRPSLSALFGKGIVFFLGFMV